MAHILITSGPTRQYLDPVRYLTNASSGRMGAALAQAALDLGHRVTIVSGPVMIAYPPNASVIDVVTTRDMLQAVAHAFPGCDGLIGAAAPCDYEPRQVASQKMSKTGEPLLLELVETPDVVATTACQKQAGQWIVGFALETEDVRFRALAKMERKCCDMMVLNGPSAIDSASNTVHVFARNGRELESVQGDKSHVASAILGWIQKLLIDNMSIDDALLRPDRNFNSDG